MKIAVIGWGSLVWEKRNLAIVGEFEPVGPILPIEFCRVSQDGRLTLVIDEKLGKPCVTYAAMSAFGDLDGAIENLRGREGMPTAARVGYIDLARGRRSSGAGDEPRREFETIAAWAGARSLDAAIWTALRSNFHEPSQANAPFSISAAIAYLESLDETTLPTCLNYIRKAPMEVQTPLRGAAMARWPEK